MKATLIKIDGNETIETGGALCVRFYDNHGEHYDVSVSENGKLEVRTHRRIIVEPHASNVITITSSSF